MDPSLRGKFLKSKSRNSADLLATLLADGAALTPHMIVSHSPARHFALNCLLFSDPFPNSTRR